MDGQIWVGPVEFSTGDIIAILAIMAALFLAIPTRGSSAKHFFIGLIVTAFIQALVIAVGNALQS